MALTFPDIDPIALSIGPFDIRWYALAYLAGFLIGWKYAAYLCARFFQPDATEIKDQTRRLPFKQDIDDFLTWIIIGVILGGRFGYVLFYQLDYYLDDPLLILKIWQGGMSFHGGLVGAGIVTVLFARKRLIRLLPLADVLACAAPIGLFFGRLANFINGELYGRVTGSPIGMVFPAGGDLPRHPSQLYESLLEGAVLFVVLFICARKGFLQSCPGFMVGMFLLLYGVFRAGIEFFREPDVQIGYIWGYFTMGQFLCVPMMVLGALMIKYAIDNRKA